MQLCKSLCISEKQTESLDFLMASKSPTDKPVATAVFRYFLPCPPDMKKVPKYYTSGLCLILLHKIAVRTGLEPVTPCVTGMYSNQLN